MTTTHFDLSAFSEVLAEPAVTTILAERIPSPEKTSLIELMQQHLAQLSPVDKQKIEALKERIRQHNGQLPNDPLEQANRIAANLLQLEKDLFNK